MNSFLEIGMKVSIEVVGKEKNRFFPSKIEDIKSGNLVVGMPIKGNSIIGIPLNSIIHLNFLQKDTIYRLDCLVLRKRYNPIPVLILEPLGFPYRHQRRDYFRVNVNIDVMVTIIDDDKCLKGTIKNISGSGALLALPEYIKKGKMLLLKYPIENKILESKAEVVRVEKDNLRRINPYDIAVNFSDISEDTRDALIKFALTVQRELRKKGIL